MREFRVGLIGVGRIAKHHFEAAQSVKGFTIVAAYDCDPAAYKTCPDNTAHCTSFNDIISQNLDAVIVATPTATHEAIAEDVVKAGIPLILEKPATLSMASFERLKQSSDNHGVPVYTLFHASFGHEVLQAKRYLPERSFNSVFWHSKFLDPYQHNNKAKSSLYNSWVDSGINAVSVFQRLVEPLKMELIASTLTPSNSQTWGQISAVNIFEFSGRISGIAVFETNWNTGQNHKGSQLRLSNQHRIILDHTAQSLIIHQKGETRRLGLDSEKQRLTNHYIAMFKDVRDHFGKGKSNWAFSHRVHTPFFAPFPISKIAG